MKLLKDTLTNSLGPVVAVLLVIALTPVLLASYGTERFGIFSLFVAIVGAASVFDFGIGKSITLLVISNRNDVGYQKQLATSALTLTAGLTLAAGLLYYGIALLVDLDQKLNIPGQLKDEFYAAYWIAGLALPAATIGSIAKGYLEAHAKYRAIAVARILSGVTGLLLPISFSLFSNDIRYGVAGLVLSRMLLSALYVMPAFESLRHASIRLIFKNEVYKKVLSNAGWISISNILNPLFSYVDKIILAATATLTGVAAYSVANSVISLFAILPGALSTVLLNSLAGSRSTRNGIIASAYSLLVGYIVLVVIFLYVTSTLLFSYLFDVQNAATAKSITDVLLVGLFFNAIAIIPYTRLMASGSVNVPAKCHVLEIIVFVPTCYVLATNFQEIGAAWAWNIRVIIDCALLQVFVHRSQGK